MEKDYVDEGEEIIWKEGYGLYEGNWIKISKEEYLEFLKKECFYFLKKLENE